jgi:hypothetical protein
VVCAGRANAHRRQLRCSVCLATNRLDAVQCAQKRCSQAFHVRCAVPRNAAQERGDRAWPRLYAEDKPYCGAHWELASPPEQVPITTSDDEGGGQPSSSSSSSSSLRQVEYDENGEEVSEYERLRRERILANAEFLAGLGLGGASSSGSGAKRRGGIAALAAAERAAGPSHAGKPRAVGLVERRSERAAGRTLVSYAETTESGKLKRSGEEIKADREARQREKELKRLAKEEEALATAAEREVMRARREALLEEQRAANEADRARRQEEHDARRRERDEAALADQARREGLRQQRAAAEAALRAARDATKAAKDEERLAEEEAKQGRRLAREAEKAERRWRKALKEQLGATKDRERAERHAMLAQDREARSWAKEERRLALKSGDRSLQRREAAARRRWVGGGPLGKRKTSAGRFAHLAGTQDPQVALY